MKIKVYNLQGKETGEYDLSENIFNVKVKPEVVHEVFVAQQNNQREPWADTKNRGEVSGGGKKPWRQKGTGRARHGSIRSPIWKGGGVTFGPLSVRSYKTKINKLTRRAALKMCLTDKVQNNLLIVVEDFNFAEPKTKLFVDFLKVLPIKKSSYLVLTNGLNKNVVKMTSNLRKVTPELANQVNVMELMNTQAVLISKDGLKKLEETCKN